MVFIYTSTITSRLEYITRHLFKNVLGVDYLLTNDKGIFLKHSGARINYSSDNQENGIRIQPCGLLEEDGISSRVDLKESMWEDLFCFFSNGEKEIPFDIFSASFYLLTSYEEYLSSDRDEHSRFCPDRSLAFKNGFLEIPLIDRWAYKLKNILIEIYGEHLTFELRPYKAINTFDIDHPYTYRNKGLLKNMYGALRDLFSRNGKNVTARISTMAHLTDDPFFRPIRWIDAFHKQMKREYYLFVLISKYGRYGRSTIYAQRRYFNYLRQLKDVNLGLHASYYTLLDVEQTFKEKTKLERILRKDISINRQHYLRIQIPGTFRLLNDLGIKDDFSLSYARMPGFRSSTAIPYYFFDIERNEQTSLLLHPTVVMDSCLIIHQGLSPEASLEKLKKLAQECKRSGGDFLMLWHNTNLTGTLEENPWINVFIESYKYALSLEK